MPLAKIFRIAALAAAMTVVAGGAAIAAPDTACSTAEETKGLRFAVAALVNDDKSQPDDVHLKKESYKLDEPLRLFLVPAGYICTKLGEGTGATFRLSIQLIYRGDVVADQPNLKTFDFHSAEKIKVIRINVDDKITGLVPGAFALRVTLVDTIGDRSAEVILPFAVAP